jgi:site-specific recombinase XerD
MAPERAVERYLNERKADLADSTYYNHSSMLKQFVEWCEQEGIEAVNDLDSFHVSDFKIHRRDEDGINNVTLYNQMTTLKLFLQWCESRGLVEGLSESMILPERGDAARDTMIEPDEARRILQYLYKYDYASQQHALFALLWDTGFRLGTVLALDVDDYHADGMYVEVHHRPEDGTPLKNQEKAEREVNLHEWVREVLDDYVADRRPDVTDENDRRPLIATKHGRPSRTTLRKRIRCLTRPCECTGKCPRGRDLDECEATTYTYAARCPGSVPPHALRRSATTAWLNDGHSKELVSDRMNVSKKILDKHYDGRSESEKRELRREMFEMDSNGVPGLSDE